MDENSQHSCQAGDFGAAEPMPVIVIMGTTGCGKSSFIKTLGEKDLQGTIVPGAYTAEIQNRRVYLLDTPGFSDCAKENITTLNDIALNLHVIALRNTELEIRGVIFMHDISDVRLAGSQRKSWEILRTLAGKECMQNIIVGTTMWRTDYLRKSEFETEEKREKGLLSTRWRGIHKTMRVTYGDKVCARQIIAEILSRPPVVLLIQKEMMTPPHTIENTTSYKIAIRYNKAAAEQFEKEWENERKRQGELKRMGEEERVKRETEVKRQVEEVSPRKGEGGRRQQDECQRQPEEEWARQDEEHKSVLEERFHRQEEAQKKWQENQRKEEDYKRQFEEECARKYEERRHQLNKQFQRQEEAQKKLQEDYKRQFKEECARKYEERRCRLEGQFQRQKEVQKKWHEENQRQQEDCKRQLEEEYARKYEKRRGQLEKQFQRQEEAVRRREEAVRSREVAVRSREEAVRRREKGGRGR